MYDVIVIGSGVGGLSTAALLARAGYKILLTEKYERLGGNFSTIEYKGFKLPTGAIGVEIGGPVEKVFKATGADFTLTPVPAQYYWIHGKYYKLPEQGGVRSLLDMLNKTRVDRMKLMGRLAKEVATEKIMGALKRGIKGEEKVEMSFRDWLLQYTDDEEVLSIFRSIIFALFSVNEAEMPASTFFRFVSREVGHGYRFYGHAPRGNIVLMNSLADVIKGHGGEVWMNAEARKIVIKNGKVKSVVIRKEEDEVELETQVVISDTGPKKTVEMAGKDNFESGYVKKVQELKACPIITFLIASDQPLVDLNGTASVVGCNSLYWFDPVTNISPEVAPPGRHLLVAFGNPRSSLQPMNARMEIERNFQDLEKIFPDFQNRAEILRTDVRNIDDEWPAYHVFPGQELPLKTSIRNLYLVGDGVKRPGLMGLPGCAQTGLDVEELVKKEVKPS